MTWGTSCEMCGHEDCSWVRGDTCEKGGKRISPKPEPSLDHNADYQKLKDHAILACESRGHLYDTAFLNGHKHTRSTLPAVSEEELKKIDTALSEAELFVKLKEPARHIVKVVVLTQIEEARAILNRWPHLGGK